MYLKKTYKAGRTIEVHKSYSARYGRNIARGKNTGHTPEAMARYNEKMAFRTLTRLINENFAPKDIHLVLTYRREARPEAAEAKKSLERFLRKLRAYFKARGQELKYIAVTAYGTRGAIHHHLVINTMDARDIRELWPHGGSHCEYLYGDGEYSALAWYLIRQARTHPAAAERITGKRWSQSKNLRRVEPSIQEVDAKAWKEEPKPIKGYYIDPNSIENGISPVTGIPYQFYRMIKIDAKARKQYARGRPHDGQGIPCAAG